jgi:hypothetical protein
MTSFSPYRRVSRALAMVQSEQGTTPEEPRFGRVNVVENRPCGTVYRGYLCLEGQRKGSRQGIPASAARMPRCDHCDAHVSDRFARVFAEEDGQVYACPNCSANAGIAEVSRDRAHE